MLLAKLEEIDKNIDSVVKPANTDDDKAKVEEAFTKRGIGKPASSFESKQPKEQTLEFYKITKKM